MARLPILIAPDRRLKQVSLPVVQIDDDVRCLMDNMAETMYGAPGIGLAAPQVGVLKRIVVMDPDYSRKGCEKNPIFLVNPEIVERHGEVVWDEGCLSVPEHTSEVSRAMSVRVRALNRDNQWVEITGEELTAVCLQHEIDHLDGILYIDHISRLKRSIILQKLKKQKKDL